MGTVLGGKPYETWMAQHLPEGPNRISAYFQRWDSVPLRLSGLLQTLVGLAMLRGAREEVIKLL